MKYILLIVFGLFAGHLYADKYDDFVAKTKQQTPNIAFYNYQQYQKENPEISNVYFQLGKISFDYLQQANPISDLKAFQYYAYSAKLYYGNCLHFATDNDVRKYALHYTGVNFSTKPNVKQLSAHIRPILKEIATISDAGKKLHETFANLSSNYERCVQIYLALNTKFNSFNEALIQANAEDIEMMHTLQNISDSIPIYIDHYKQALNQYPIAGYAPQFEIIPIELFRIDALCSVNFLNNHVILYDFGTWVKEFNQRRETRVIPILAEALNAYQKQIEHTNFQAPVTLINSLYQLDSESYPASVLQIQNMYNQIINTQKKLATTPENDKRLAMVYDIGTMVKIAQEQYARLQRVTAADTSKYAAFTAAYFSEAMPADVLQETVKQTEAIYNVLLQEFQIQANITSTQQTDSNTITIDCRTDSQATLCYQPNEKRNQLTIKSATLAISKTNINIDARPKSLFYIPDADQLIFAHDIFNDTLATWNTHFTIYDFRTEQLSKWISIPQVENIAYITLTDKGHAIMVNEKTTQAVALYIVNMFDQITRRPILTDAARILNVGHYNSDYFIVHLMRQEKNEILLVEK